MPAVLHKKSIHSVEVLQNVQTFCEAIVGVCWKCGGRGIGRLSSWSSLTELSFIRLSLTLQHPETILAPLHPGDQKSREPPTTFPSLEVGSLNAARGSGDRCKLPSRFRISEGEFPPSHMPRIIID